jgi:hypothetical protein
MDRPGASFLSIARCRGANVTVGVGGPASHAQVHDDR